MGGEAREPPPPARKFLANCTRASHAWLAAEGPTAEDAAASPLQIITLSPRFYDWTIVGAPAVPLLRV